MKMNMKMRVLTLVATMGLLGGTAIIASGSTGAYFSDSVGGGITGTVGSIHITPSTVTTLSFSNLLPGAAQSQSVNYENTGSSPEDVYLTFPNLTALSALNNLGRYGSVTVGNQNGPLFKSLNLDDNATRCGPFDTNPTDPSDVLCNPLPAQILVASNVPSGGTGTITFSFEYASLLSTQPATLTAPWNSWPQEANPAGTDYASCVAATDPSGNACTNNQFTVVPSDGSGSGLPFTIVATQVGITPGQVGSKF